MTDWMFEQMFDMATPAQIDEMVNEFLDEDLDTEDKIILAHQGEGLSVEEAVERMKQ